MVHTEFSDDVDRFPYNVNDGADINEVLVVSWELNYLVLEITLLPSEIFNSAIK